MLNENNSMMMPVAPLANGGGLFGGNGGNDFFSIIVLFFLLMICGGWGNGNGNGGAANGSQLYPWMNQQAQMQDGFQNQQLATQIEGIHNGQTTGFGDVNLGLAGIGRQICETGNGITGAVRDGFYGAEIAAGNRQMASMQQLFGIQTGIGDVKYTIGNEGCQTRNQALINTRDIIDNDNRNHQAVMDKLCQLELDGVKAERDAERRANAELREQITRLTFASSQTDQTAAIRQYTATALNQMLSEMRSCPIPAQPVYGPTPIFTCGNQGGCVCGQAA